jgi:hypothetical protein
VSIALIAVIAGLVVTAPAAASFPGAPGVLVVAPLRGPGLDLLGPRGGHVERVCTDRRLCGIPRQPRWSPDGREIVFDLAGSRRLLITGATGACLWCLSGKALSPFAGTGSAFTPDGEAVTFVRGGHLRAGRWPCHARPVARHAGDGRDTTVGERSQAIGCGVVR